MTRIPENVTNVLRRIADITGRLEEFSGPTQARSASPFGQLVEQSMGRTPAVPGQYEVIIARAAERYGLRPALLRGVITAESGFNPRAVSRAGAQGLMQLMPGTAAALGVSDPFDPEQNIMAGAHYLRQQLDRFDQDERLALAAYNAGPGAVMRYNGVPPYAETQHYVTRVLSLASEDE